MPLATPPASTTDPLRYVADHRRVVRAADDDDDDLRSAVDRRDGERIAQYLPDIARLHVRIAVVQRVGPQPGGGERIGAVAFGARGRRVDRGPGVAWVVVVDVGGIEVAGRGERARRAVGDTAGLHHRLDEIATDHCSVVGAGDGDGHQLLGAVDRRDGERVGQRLPAIEPLNGGVAVVQRVDPQPGGGERIAAVATGAVGRRADGRPGVVRIVEVGGAQIAGRGGRAGVTVVELARLHHRAGHRAGDVGVVVGAVDGDGHQLLGAADREGRKRIGQRLPDIARLHGGIVVVQRVGPHPGCVDRERAELAQQRRVDGDPGVVRIVDVGRVQIARRGRGARCAVIDAAGLGHRLVGGAADHCGVVGAGDGDGHRLLGAVRCHRREGVGQRLPALSACTAVLLSSSV